MIMLDMAVITCMHVKGVRDAEDARDAREPGMQRRPGMPGNAEDVNVRWMPRMPGIPLMQRMQKGVRDA